MSHMYLNLFQMINYTSDITKFIQKLVSIPSVNGINNEVEIIKTIKSEADKLGLPNKIIFKDKNHPNIFVGENFDKKTGLLLIAHVDTAGIGDETKWVHKPFGSEIENNKLYGRGAIDNKAGIALSLYSLKILKDQGKLHLANLLVYQMKKRVQILFLAQDTYWIKAYRQKAQFTHIQVTIQLQLATEDKLNFG